MTPERLELDRMSDLDASFDRYRFADPKIDVLVMAVRGVWGHGSAGNPDARAMLARARAALVAWDPDALVFDFRELDYQWGDAMLALLDVDTEVPLVPLATEVVAGPRSVAALTSLGAAVGSDLDVAIERARARAGELRALDDAHEMSLKMYILVADWVEPGFAALAAAHAAVATFEAFDRRWETRAWIGGVFRKVICRVDSKQFERARQLDDRVVITESALDGAEVAVGLMPRVEWPGWVRHLPLYR